MELGDYALREINREDLPQFLAWRNSPKIHSRMLTDHIITWEEHLAWFERMKQQTPPLHFAFTYRGELAGYLGYPRYDRENKTCNIGDYLGVNLNLPVDAGIHLGKMSFEYAFCELRVNSIITEVIVDNRRVLNLNLMAGYKILGESYIQKNGESKKIAKLELQYDIWKKMYNS